MLLVVMQDVKYYLFSTSTYAYKLVLFFGFYNAYSIYMLVIYNLCCVTAMKHRLVMTYCVTLYQLYRELL